MYKIIKTILCKYGFHNWKVIEQEWAGHGSYYWFNVFENGRAELRPGVSYSYDTKRFCKNCGVLQVRRIDD